MKSEEESGNGSYFGMCVCVAINKVTCVRSLNELCVKFMNSVPVNTRVAGQHQMPSNAVPIISQNGCRQGIIDRWRNHENER